MSESWPKLSETLPGPVTPDRCQSCGAWGDTDRWREHDEHDQPTPVVVVLCRPCSDKIIEPHPRLYARLQGNEPHAGAMPLCLDCQHRDGTRCAHPGARANGGPGIEIYIKQPYRVHVCRSPRRLSGWETLWPAPAQGCSGKEPVA
jgi:hypothetical protein